MLAPFRRAKDNYFQQSHDLFNIPRCGFYLSHLFLGYEPRKNSLVALAYERRHNLLARRYKRRSSLSRPRRRRPSRREATNLPDERRGARAQSGLVALVVRRRKRRRGGREFGAKRKQIARVAAPIADNRLINANDRQRNIKVQLFLRVSFQ